MGKYDDIIDNPKDKDLMVIAEINELAEQNRCYRLDLKLRYLIQRRPVKTTDVVPDSEFEDQA